MASSNLCMIMIVVMFVMCTRSFVTNGRTMLGGRTKVADVEKSKEVQDMGKYAVEEYNGRLKRSGSGPKDGDHYLTFSGVVEAEKQVVAGTKYFLKIQVVEEKNGGGLKEFEAVVVVKPWLNNSKQLLKFSPSFSSSSVPLWFV